MVNKITLSGFAGTGKSTVGKLLANALDFEFISVGNYSRKFALEKFNMTINEFQELVSRKPEIDKAIDSEFQNYCNARNNLVIDYRLGFHFIKDAFHVLLKVSDDEAFKRISHSGRTNEDYSLSAINIRNEIMKDRFLNSYGVDFTDESNYRLVLDTSFISPEEVVFRILSAIK